MNTRKIFFSLFTILTLFAASCTAEDSEIYETGIDRKHVTKGTDAIDRKHVTKGTDAIDRKHVTKGTDAVKKKDIRKGPTQKN